MKLPRIYHHRSHELAALATAIHRRVLPRNFERAIARIVRSPAGMPAGVPASIPDSVELLNDLAQHENVEACRFWILESASWPKVVMVWHAGLALRAYLATHSPGDELFDEIDESLTGTPTAFVLYGLALKCLFQGKQP